MKLPSIKYLLLIAAFVLAFTPYYGLAYIIMLFFAVRIVRFSRTFSTVFARSILSLLLLAATIMFVGLIAWFAHLHTYPVLVLVVFGLLLAVFNKYSEQDAGPSKFIDKGDVISLVLAFVPVAVLLYSFALPKPSMVANYQFASDGWDNGSHILMLETDSTAKGYVYGRYSDVGAKTITNSGSYPQGWHLATANLTNGFGTNLFNAHHPLTVINTYIVVSLLWLILAAYSFWKIAWRLLASKDPSTNLWLSIPLFAVAGLVIQMIVFWGGIVSGFTNYVGSLAYIVLFVVALIDSSERDSFANYTLAFIAGMAATLTWILPLPAMILTALMWFIGISRLAWRALLPRISRRSYALFIIGVATVIAALAQIAIFVFYASVKGSEQLTVGVSIDATGEVNGVFPVSQLLFAIVVMISLYFWVNAKALSNKAVALISPWIIASLALYAYQLLTTGYTSYYLSKLLGIALVVSGLFFVPAFVIMVSSFSKKMNLANPSAAILGLSFISLLIIGTNQSTLGFNKLFQRNSKVTYQTASAVVDYLRHDNPLKSNIIVLRGQKHYEDYNGKLETRVSHTPYNCTYSIIGNKSSTRFNVELDRLNKCADKLGNRKIVVITSNKTMPAILALHKKNIQVINVP